MVVDKDNGTIHLETVSDGKLIASLNSIKIGYSYKVNLPQIARFRRLHIRAIIDGSHVVYAFYGKNKKWWHYGIESIFMLDILIENNRFDLDSQLKTPSKYFDWR